MFREYGFKFKVLIPEPIDNGIIDPWFAHVGGAVGSIGVDKLDLGRFGKVLPVDDGMIDGIPAIDVFDGGGLMGF